jgi:dTDP-4-dehydrorhamnose reductase
MKALITGASGFIGSHLCADLRQQGFEVIALRNSNPLGSSTPIGVIEEICDIRQRASIHSIINKYKPELVIHAAALANSTKCENSPELCQQVNVEGTANIASSYDTASDKPVLIYLSTDLIFEGRNAAQGGFSEESEPQPLSNYAKSKLQGEEIWKEIPFATFIFRACLTYGQRISGSPSPLSWLCEAFENNKEVNLFHDEWRTPVCVQDISRASIALFNKFERTKPQNHEIFNLAGPDRFSRVEIGRAVARAFGYKQDLIIEKSRLEFKSTTPRAHDVSLSCQKLRSELGLEPKDFFSWLAEQTNATTI